MKRSSSLSPLYDEDFLELVWENGQILVRGGSSSNRTQNNVSITGRSRLSTVYSLLDEFQPHKETDLRSSSHQGRDQHSCQIDLRFSKSKNSSKLQEELANSSSRSPEKDPNKLAGNNNNQLRTYSPSQQCSPSSPPKKPRVDSSQSAPAPATTKSNTQNLMCDHRTGKVNFSNFLIPALSLRSSRHQENAVNQPTRNACSSAREEEIEAGKVEKIPVAAAASISEVPEAFGRNNSALRIQGSHHVQHYNETPSSAAPKAKGIANKTGFCNEPLPACSSVCSLVASNYPKVCIRKQEYTTDDSTYLSDKDEETEDVIKETPPWEVARVKRSRNVEIHNLSDERKRRDNINKKIRRLKELIPNCNKVDKASTLDDAIDYLKTLKLQLQIMSMGSGLCNPLMMLPAAVNAPPHLPPQLMGAGMCFRPAAGTGFPCSPPQFPIPPLAAITDTTLLNMFGFSNHMRPMAPISHHHAPFIPMNNGNPPPTPPLMPPTTTTTTTPTNLAEHLANSASLDDLHVNAEYAAAIMQAANPASLHHHSSSGYPFYFPTGKEENKDIIGQQGRTRKM